jgi:hypothetical protein
MLFDLGVQYLRQVIYIEDIHSIMAKVIFAMRVCGRVMYSFMQWSLCCVKRRGLGGPKGGLNIITNRKDTTLAGD